MNRRGLTLLDIIVIVAVIGLAAGLILPRMARDRNAANNSKCMSNLKNIGTSAVGIYVNNYGRPPTPTGFEFFRLLYVTNAPPAPEIYTCPADNTVRGWS